ncbi:MAG: hypothetical protein OHK0053_35660 [Microscillaceae bacterium]
MVKFYYDKQTAICEKVIHPGGIYPPTSRLKLLRFQKRQSELLADAETVPERHHCHALGICYTA